MSRIASPPETPAPPVGPPYVGYWDLQGRVHGWRPRGTSDWLLLYTEAGSCRIGHAQGAFETAVGDIVLIEPGTPQDYGQHRPGGRWKHVWAHWVPVSSFVPLLAWPLMAPGIRRLSLPIPLRKRVLGELCAADAALRGRRPYGEVVATNALERAVILCEGANPRKGKSPWHPRIEEAVAYLTTHFARFETMDLLARRFGFSRSRFAELFRGQVGQTPARYVEAQRLLRARQLLSYTRQTLEQIADHVGFSSPFHLSLRFKRHFGKSPRAFRHEKDPSERGGVRRSSRRASSRHG